MGIRMLSTETRLRVEGIIQRIAAGEAVTLNERIQLRKYSNHIPYIAGKLNQALRKRRTSEE